jgi:hypothetical protein
MGIDGPAIDIIRVAPDIGEKTRAGLSAAAAFEEQGEQAKLGGSQYHFVVA